jgi:predicted ATPase
MRILRKVDYKVIPTSTQFPFMLPLFKHFSGLEFSSQVTFFVGENGTGKSTLLESIALGMKIIPIASQKMNDDISLIGPRRLADSLRFVKNQNQHRGFFLRAEDFFGFIKKVDKEMMELKELESEYEEKFTGYAQMLAMGSVRGQRKAFESNYGENPHASSHGESFLNLFESRFVPNGLYLLDEPETPLSPLRQLSLLSMIKRMVDDGCQFIIATHSPILMAYPEAQIISFDDNQISQITFDEVEHVNLTRNFLNNPDNYLRRL